MQWSHTLTNIWPSTLHRCHGFLERITGKSWAGIKSVVDSPLLSKQDLHQLYAAATTQKDHGISTQQEVKTLLVGERSSAYAGSGYEFADNQRYITGDDSRFINWRMLARTGKLYRKVFNEERRPQLWVVVDKRASMRFGTNKRLKVTQAAIQAIYHLYQAQQQQLACGGVVLDEQPCWFNPGNNLNALQPLIEQIIAPTPPLFQSPKQNTLNIILRQLVERLSPGSIIIFASDFYDLDNEALGTLHALASSYTVVAKHIIDPIEQSLPIQGKFQVYSAHNTQPLTLDCDDPVFRQHYFSRMKQQQDHIENQLHSAGVNYQRCLSNTDIVGNSSYEQ